MSAVRHHSNKYGSLHLKKTQLCTGLQWTVEKKFPFSALSYKIYVSIFK